MKRRDVLVGDGDRLAALTDGFATIRVSHTAGPPWACTTSAAGGSQPVGYFHLDQRAFDAIWSA